MKRPQEIIVLVTLVLAVILIAYKASHPVLPDADTLSQIATKASFSDKGGESGPYVPLILFQQAGWVATLLLLPVGIVFLKNRSISRRLKRKQEKSVRLYRHTLSKSLSQRLLSAFPTLTAYELSLCDLLLNNHTSKEIATQLNINPGSVNTARYRLRKKLQVPPDMELTVFLHQFKP